MMTATSYQSLRPSESGPRCSVSSSFSMSIETTNSESKGATMPAWKKKALQISQQQSGKETPNRFIRFFPVEASSTQSQDYLVGVRPRGIPAGQKIDSGEASEEEEVFVTIPYWVEEDDEDDDDDDEVEHHRSASETVPGDRAVKRVKSSSGATVVPHNSGCIIQVVDIKSSGKIVAVDSFSTEKSLKLWITCERGLCLRLVISHQEIFAQQRVASSFDDFAQNLCSLEESTTVHLETTITAAKPTATTAASSMDKSAGGSSSSPLLHSELLVSVYDPNEDISDVLLLKHQPSENAIDILPLYRIRDRTAAVLSLRTPIGHSSSIGGAAAGKEEEEEVISLSVGVRGNVDLWSITQSEDRGVTFGDLDLGLATDKGNEERNGNNNSLVAVTCARICDGLLFCGLSNGSLRVVKFETSSFSRAARGKGEGAPAMQPSPQNPVVLEYYQQVPSRSSSAASMASTNPRESTRTDGIVSLLTMGAENFLWAAADDGQIVVWDVSAVHSRWTALNAHHNDLQHHQPAQQQKNLRPLKPCGIFTHAVQAPFVAVASLKRSLVTSLVSYDTRGNGRLWNIEETLVSDGVDRSIVVSTQGLLGDKMSPSAGQVTTTSATLPDHEVKKFSEEEVEVMVQQQRTDPLLEEIQTLQDVLGEEQEKRKRLGEELERAQKSSDSTNLAAAAQASSDEQQQELKQRLRTKEEENLALKEFIFYLGDLIGGGDPPMQHVPAPPVISAHHQGAQFLPDALGCMGDATKVLTEFLQKEMQMESSTLLQDLRLVCDQASSLRGELTVLQEQLVAERLEKSSVITSNNNKKDSASSPISRSSNRSVSAATSPQANPAASPPRIKELKRELEEAQLKSKEQAERNKKLESDLQTSRERNQRTVDTVQTLKEDLAETQTQIEKYKRKQRLMFDRCEEASAALEPWTDGKGFPVPVEIRGNAFESLLCRAECITELLQQEQNAQQGRVVPTTPIARRQAGGASTKLSTSPAPSPTPFLFAQQNGGGISPITDAPAASPLGVAANTNQFHFNQLQTELADSKELVRTLEEEVASLASSRQELVKQVSQLKSKVNAAENAKLATVAELEEEKEASRHGYDRLESQLQTSKQALQKARSDHKRYEAEIQQLRESLENERKALFEKSSAENLNVETKEAFERKIRQMQEQLEEQSQNHFREMNTAKSEGAKANRDQMAAAQVRIDDLEEQLAEAAASEKRRTKKHKQELEEDADRRISEEKTRRDALSRQIKTLQGELETKNRITKELVEVVQTNDQTIKELTDRFEETKAEVSTLKKKLLSATTKSAAAGVVGSSKKPGSILLKNGGELSPEVASPIIKKQHTAQPKSDAEGELSLGSRGAGGANRSYSLSTVDRDTETKTQGLLQESKESDLIAEQTIAALKKQKDVLFKTTTDFSPQQQRGGGGGRRSTSSTGTDYSAHGVLVQEEFVSEVRTDRGEKDLSFPASARRNDDGLHLRDSHPRLQQPYVSPAERSVSTSSDAINQQQQPRREQPSPSSMFVTSNSAYAKPSHREESGGRSSSAGALQSFDGSGSNNLSSTGPTFTTVAAPVPVFSSSSTRQGSGAGGGSASRGGSVNTTAAQPPSLLANRTTPLLAPASRHRSPPREDGGHSSDNVSSSSGSRFFAVGHNDGIENQHTSNTPRTGGGNIGAGGGAAMPPLAPVSVSSSYQNTNRTLLTPSGSNFKSDSSTAVISSSRKTDVFEEPMSYLHNQKNTSGRSSPAAAAPPSQSTSFVSHLETNLISPERYEGDTYVYVGGHKVKADLVNPNHSQTVGVVQLPQGEEGEQFHKHLSRSASAHSGAHFLGVNENHDALLRAPPPPADRGGVDRSSAVLTSSNSTTYRSSGGGIISSPRSNQSSSGGIHFVEPPAGGSARAGGPAVVGKRPPPKLGKRGGGDGSSVDTTTTSTATSSSSYLGPQYKYYPTGSAGAAASSHNNSSTSNVQSADLSGMSTITRQTAGGASNTTTVR